MNQPDVALTDYGLTIECATFLYLLKRSETLDGFFPEVEALGYRILWPGTLLALGVTALSGWAVGARIQFPGAARVATIAATIEFIAYAGVALSGRHNALYHVVQAVALLMIFWSARWFIARGNWPPGSPHR